MKIQMTAEELPQSIFCLQPSRPILCSTKNEDGSDHVAPFGWCTPVSQTPPMLTLAIQHCPRKSQTLTNIERSGEFVVNLPDLELAEALISTAFDTRQGENKFDRAHLTRLPSKVVKPCCVAECRAHLECRVKEIHYPGDHGIIVGEILNARYDKEAFRDNMLIDVNCYHPMIHLQNFNLREGGGQLHLFLDSRGVTATQVSYPGMEKTK